MIPVLDVPLIDLAIGRGGDLPWVTRFVNVSGKLNELRDHLASSHSGIEVFDEGAEGIGTAATLRSLLSRLGRRVVTYNCDLVSDLPVKELLRQHCASQMQCTLAVKRVGRHADIDAEGGRLRLIDRREEDRAGYLFLGAACFEKELLERVPPDRPLGLVEGLLGHVFNRQQVGLFHHHGYARDAGTLARYLAVSQDALSGAFHLDSPGVVSPSGWYLGPGASAESASLGEGAVVLAGADVGTGARLTKCIVFPGAPVPAGAQLHGGIWDDGSFLAA